VGRKLMQWCSAICLLVAALGVATGETSTEPSPTLEGLNPSQIEKIMIEQILAKPKGSGKEAFDFVKTVKPILDTFKKQMIADKKKNAEHFEWRCRRHQKMHKKNEKKYENGFARN